MIVNYVSKVVKPRNFEYRLDDGFGVVIYNHRVLNKIGNGS